MGLKKIFRFVLFGPVSAFVYGILWFRHRLYDWHILKSRRFDIPVINVGNLNLGGSGKTPMVEYLSRFLLSKNKKVAVLSRGYKRKTKGFVLADEKALPENIGDEPYQIYLKFKNSAFCLAVAENRAEGITKLQENCRPDVIILDDAFQHRRIQAGMNILLTLFDKTFDEDSLFPLGNLRDLPDRARAADMIVVTKSPQGANKRKKEIEKRLKIYGKEIFFSYLAHENPVNQAGGQISWDELRQKNVLLITGIARVEPLYRFLNAKKIKFASIAFPDHAKYGNKELNEIRKMMERKKIDVVLTTEKDFYKLKNKIEALYYIPVRAEIEEKEKFNQKILNYANTGKFV